MATNAQAMRALAVGNDLRLRRAAERRRIVALDSKAGRRELADLLEELPAWLAGEQLGRFLRWPRRMGAAAAHRMIAFSGVRATTLTRLSALTERQREVLVTALRADGGIVTRLCNGCQRTLPCWNFPPNGNGTSGGWRDYDGTLRRGRCYACERQRHRASYEQSVNAPIHDDWGPPLAKAPAALPAEPFAQWLERKRKVFRIEHEGGDDEFGRVLGIAPRRVRGFIQREADFQMVRFSTVDRVLTREGSTALWELYGDLYPDVEPQLPGNEEEAA